MKRHPLRGILVPLVLAACNDANVLSEKHVADGPVTQQVIFDAAHSAGSSGFYFLPPMVRQPSFGGSFDASLLPHTRVEVCELPVSSCVSAGTVRVADSHYAVNWRAAGDPAKTYRIRVLAAGTQLGFADVKLARNASELKNIDSNDYVGVVINQTLPIRFRIEEGAVEVIGSSGGVASFANGAVTIDVPPGALRTSLGFTVAPVSGPVPEGAVAGTQFVFGPEGVTFDQPILVSIEYDPSVLTADQPEAALWLFKSTDAGLVGVTRGEVDTGNHTVSGYVSGFSTWLAAISVVSNLILQASSLIPQLIFQPGIVNIALQIRSVLTQLALQANRPEFHYLTQTFYEHSRRDVCNQLVDRTNVAMTTAVRTFGDIAELTRPVANWRAIGDKIPEFDCSVTPIPDVFNKLATDFTSFYSAKLNTTISTFDFQKLIAELEDLRSIRTQASSFGLTQLQSDVETKAIVPLGNALRQKAFDVCRTTGDQTLLFALVEPAQRGETTYTFMDLANDIQMCGTRINWELLNPAGATRANGTAQEPTLGVIQNSFTTRSLTQGTLRFSGFISKLHCQNTTSREEIAVEVNGIPVAAFPQSGGGYLQTAVTIALNDIHKAVPIDPTVRGTHKLSILRVGNLCGGAASGTGSYALAEIDLKYPELTLTVSPTAATVASGATQQFSASGSGAQNGVKWTATGGTIQPNGVFTAGTIIGSFKVTATSVEDPMLTTDATVTITSAGAARLDSRRCESAVETYASASVGYYFGGGDSRTADDFKINHACGAAENTASRISFAGSTADASGSGTTSSTQQGSGNLISGLTASGTASFTGNATAAVVADHYLDSRAAQARGYGSTSFSATITPTRLVQFSVRATVSLTCPSGAGVRGESSGEVYVGTERTTFVYLTIDCTNPTRNVSWSGFVSSGIPVYFSISARAGATFTVANSYNGGPIIMPRQPPPPASGTSSASMSMTISVK